jgi:hypothetical protein
MDSVRIIHICNCKPGKVQLYRNSCKIFLMAYNHPFKQVKNILDLKKFSEWLLRLTTYDTFYC